MWQWCGTLVELFCHWLFEVNVLEYQGIIKLVLNLVYLTLVTF
jgi:hypothetical protein